MKICGQTRYIRLNIKRNKYLIFFHKIDDSTRKKGTSGILISFYFVISFILIFFFLIRILFIMEEALQRRFFLGVKLKKKKLDELKC